jgi:hypothetical protein
MFIEFWQSFYKSGLIAVLLFLPAALFFWLLNRSLNSKDPNSLGMRILEVLPNQISVRIAQPGNLYQLKKDGLNKNRVVLDLNRMDERGRSHVLYLIGCAGKSHGSEIMNLGDNIYVVEGGATEFLPEVTEVKLPPK